MRRRDFIAAPGASAWPLPLPAQQHALPVIGLISLGSADAFADNIRAFHKGLGGAGYVEGRNVLIDYHWLEGRHDNKAMLYGPFNFEYSRQKLRISGPTSNDN
jgi:hypothetical protein